MRIMVLARKHRQKGLDIHALAETVYLAVLAVYILKLSFDTTLFYIPWPVNSEEVLRIAACMVVLLKLACGRAYTGKEGLLCIIAVILFKLSWVSTGYTFLLDIALLIAGAFGIPYRKILKTGFWVGGYVLLIALLGSFTGCIADLVYSSSGWFRHSFGIVYPTDFAAHVTFLALTGWVLYGGKHFFLPIICTVSLAAFSYYYCRSRCSTVVLCLLALAILYFVLSEKYSRKHKNIYCITRLVDNILPRAIPFCAVLMIVLTYFYDGSQASWVRLNEILASRLSLGQSAINNYGIRMFGTAFDQIGFGGGTAWSWILDYNFVDSSYVLILIRYGVTVLLVVCAQHMLLGKKSLRNGHRHLALAVALAAVHSMIEHHLPEPAYNLFLLIPFADFTSTGLPEKEPGRKKQYPRLVCAVQLAGIAVAAIVFPRAVTYLKTIVDLLNLDNKETQIKFIGIVTIGMLAGYMFWRAIPKAITACATQKHLPGSVWAGLAVFPILILGGIASGERIISLGSGEYYGQIQADRHVINALIAAENMTGKLYIDPVPEIYRREFGYIADMVLTAEGVATSRNTTLVADDVGELHALMVAGYGYGELPSGYAIYTNNETAKNILEDIGILVTDYYSRQRTVNLEDMAAMNNLDMTEGGTLLLNGYGRSLWHGPGVTVYKGKLRVEYKLQLVSSSVAESTAGTIYICSDWGLRLYKQEDISLLAFDDNGQCTYIIDTYLSYDSPFMEFRLAVPDGVELEILEIRYGKIG